MLHGIDVTPLLVHVLRGLRLPASRGRSSSSASAPSSRGDGEAGALPHAGRGVLVGRAGQLGLVAASNIMAARSAFVANGEPLLIVRSGLFDWRLLDRMVGTADYFAQGGVDACALVDAAPETLEWVSGAHCKAYCRDGHCRARQGSGGHGDRIARIGHRLNAYDALSAGIYVVRPGAFFSEMARLLSSARFITVARRCSRLRWASSASGRPAGGATSTGLATR